MDGVVSTFTTREWTALRVARLCDTKGNMVKLVYVDQVRGEEYEGYVLRVGQWAVEGEEKKRRIESAAGSLPLAHCSRHCLVLPTITISFRRSSRLSHIHNGIRPVDDHKPYRS